VPNQLSIPREAKTTVDQTGALKRRTDPVEWEENTVRQALFDLDRSCQLVESHGRIGILRKHSGGQNLLASEQEELRIANLPPMPTQNLGNPEFRKRFRVVSAYMAGSMANGIASEELVIALGSAGLLASFGSAGLRLDRIRHAIDRIKTDLPNGPYAFNLIHSPDSLDTELAIVKTYLEAGISVVEASAFLKLDLAIVWFRVAGFVADQRGRVHARHRVIAKLSRREVAEQFMNPPPRVMLRKLEDCGYITAQQAAWAERFPVADTITAEADSAGHTDGQQLVTLLPALLSLRDQMQNQHHYEDSILIGAAGGLGTPSGMAAAFAMGADYVVTGSINQACVEAGSSARVKELLASTATSDVVMAPAADMFELGVRVQVLKRGTLFPMRAQKLYELYCRYASLEAVPLEELQGLEQHCFRKSLDSIWAEIQAYLGERHPNVLEEAFRVPKKRMAVIFRWYLSQSSAWANEGEPSRTTDYQVWCGPAMGAFNGWSAGSYLADPQNRRIVPVALILLRGAAYLTRIHFLRSLGIAVPPQFASFGPNDMRSQTEISPAASLDNSARPSAPAQTAQHRSSGLEPAVQTGGQRSAREIAAFISRQIAEQIGLSPQAIDAQRPFESFGLDSIQAMRILNRLETWLSTRLSPTLVWNYPTVEQLAQRLASPETQLTEACAQASKALPK
jgi:PfaD family protein